MDANLTLGFRDDERSYDVAVAILKKLNFKKIHLISNNPNKIEKLNSEGIDVLDSWQPIWDIIKPKIEDRLAKKITDPTFKTKWCTDYMKVTGNLVGMELTACRKEAIGMIEEKASWKEGKRWKNWKLLINIQN